MDWKIGSQSRFSQMRRTCLLWAPPSPRSRLASIVHRLVMKNEFRCMAKAMVNQVAHNQYIPDSVDAALSKQNVVYRTGVSRWKNLSPRGETRWLSRLVGSECYLLIQENQISSFKILYYYQVYVSYRTHHFSFDTTILFLVIRFWIAGMRSFFGLSIEKPRGFLLIIP